MDQQKLRTLVFEKTGVKIDVDDPVFALVALNEAVLAEAVERHVALLDDATGVLAAQVQALQDGGHIKRPATPRAAPASAAAPGLTPGARGYFDYFGAVAGPGYYRVKLGSWQVYSLDSNLKPGPAGAQLAWLKQELAANPSHCILAYWHHPLYSSGGHGSIARMKDAWRALLDAGAEMVLSGHDHDYERFAPQDAQGQQHARGIRQFVVGTGGAYSTPFLLPLRNSERRDNSRTGVLKLLLKDGAYAWEFLEAAYQGFPNGNAPDRGEGQCH